MKKVAFVSARATLSSVSLLAVVFSTLISTSCVNDGAPSDDPMTLDIEPFLFAPIGEEHNGMTLSVLSGLS